MIGTIISCPSSEREIVEAERNHSRVRLGFKGALEAEAEIYKASSSEKGCIYIEGSLFFDEQGPRTFSGILYPHPQTGFVDY